MKQKCFFEMKQRAFAFQMRSIAITLAGIRLSTTQFNVALE